MSRAVPRFDIAGSGHAGDGRPCRQPGHLEPPERRQEESAGSGRKRIAELSAIFKRLYEDSVAGAYRTSVSRSFRQTTNTSKRN